MKQWGALLLVLAASRAEAKPVWLLWVAIKLGYAGIPFFLPRALLSNSLTLQAGEKGITLQRHRGHPEAY